MRINDQDKVNTTEKTTKTNAGFNIGGSNRKVMVFGTCDAGTSI